MNARMPAAMSAEFKQCLYIRRETFAHWLLVRMTAYVRETRQSPAAVVILDGRPLDAAYPREQQDGFDAALDSLQTAHEDRHEDPRPS